MKIHFAAKSLTGLRLALTATMSATFAWADLPQVQRQIETLQRELESERQMYQAEVSRKASAENGSKSRLTEMRTQIQRARREADSLKLVLEAKGRPGQTQAAEQQKLQEWNRSFAHALAEQVDSVLAKLAREELPYYAEPKERALKDLSRGLRTGVISPDQGLGQAFDHLSEILAWGSKCEAVAGSYITSAGAPLNGFYVRVGGVFEGFVTEDGKTGAYRIKDDHGWQWKESLTAERRENLLKMARMSISGEQPGFVPVPFGLVSGGLQ
jgi:Protein of unknown function (DUF3450)